MVFFFFSIFTLYRSWWTFGFNEEFPRWLGSMNLGKHAIDAHAISTRTFVDCGALVSKYLCM